MGAGRMEGNEVLELGDGVWKLSGGFEVEFAQGAVAFG